MKRLRVPFLLMVGGFAVKGFAIALYRLFHPPALLTVLTTCDPLGVYLAHAVVEAAFPRGIAPAAAPAVFEFLLILGDPMLPARVGL